jgi:hypothetical protein
LFPEAYLSATLFPAHLLDNRTQTDLSLCRFYLPRELIDQEFVTSSGAERAITIDAFFRFLFVYEPMNANKIRIGGIEADYVSERVLLCSFQFWIAIKIWELAVEELLGMLAF